MESPTENQSKAGNHERQPGLRERKRQQTRERITRVALTLFLERGFEATTLDDIVAAAEISRRSFFHYFASKEDVVFAWQDDINEALAAEVAKRPSAEPPLLAAEQALLAVLGCYDREDALALGQLVHDTPALRVRDQAKYEALERGLASTLSRRLGSAPDGLRVRLAAMVAIGALRIGTEAWLAEGGRERPDEYARRAFNTLWADLIVHQDVSRT